jgi:cytochrome oxidase assembly protein ShyY1
LPRTTRSSFFSVARRPKYIGGLVFALLAASAFAWLGQWQLDRAINREDKAAELAATKPVTLNLFLDTRNVFVVDGRKQNSRDAWWVIANATDENGKSVTLALGTTDNELKAEAARFELQNSMRAQAFLPVTGSWLPSEEPQRIDPAKPYLLHSVSIAQLINLYSPDKPIATYSDYLKVCTSCAGGQFSTMLDQINGQTYTDGSVNWLSAFYAIEWAVFALFAVFLWYRTVKDTLEAEG